MITTALDHILFIDIETVGVSSTYEQFCIDYPELCFQYKHYYDWFQKRFAEDAHLDLGEMFNKRSALVPEFARIICVSVAFVDPKGELRKQTFFNSDEKVLLKEVNNLLDKVNKLGFILCGHNLKNFDIPMLAKRMIINGIRPSQMLPTHDTKPWEIKAIDTKEFWQYGQFGAISSLELMCVSLGVPSSKTMEVTGDSVHRAYWFDEKYDQIKEYCEKDVECLVDVIKKIKSL
jgi:predicted PolB exonuclease-like 3'-5' exonuclease